MFSIYRWVVVPKNMQTLDKSKRTVGKFLFSSASISCALFPVPGPEMPILQSKPNTTPSCRGASFGNK